jgi:hypothetical protein
LKKRKRSDQTHPLLSGWQETCHDQSPFATVSAFCRFISAAHTRGLTRFGPEIRWDYANDARVWRHGEDHYLLTAAVDCLPKF